jgi:hypothetical protein
VRSHPSPVSEPPDATAYRPAPAYGPPPVCDEARFALFGSLEEVAAAHAVCDR